MEKNKTKQWQAEYALSPVQAHSLIEKQFPQLLPINLEPLGDGWDNTAFYVNKAFVFRFPRRHMAVKWLENENLILPKIYNKVTLPIPLPLFIGKPCNNFPCPFSGYAIIPGITACRAGLSKKKRIELAATIAEFLKSLHSISAANASSFGAEPDQLGRFDIAKRKVKLFEYISWLEQKGVINNVAVIKAMLESAAIEPGKVRETLVHGDFYCRHLLVDSIGGASGIIDWGDIHIGNPAIDISIAPGFLPAEGQQIFRDVYGDIDEDTWRLARFRALSTAIILLAYGSDLNDNFLIKEASLSLKNLLNVRIT
ncbi:phosphotransferase [Candidatus Riflebacteria bacterium]